MWMKMKFVFVFALLVSSIYGQVAISPTTLVLDSKNKYATFQITNSSAVAQEVKLSFSFGYPQSDDLGNLVYNYDDPEEAKLHSAADWIRGLPKIFTLEPGGRQVVRLTVKAPRKLAAGTYWSRMKISSSQLSAEVGTRQQDAIAAQINFQVNQVFSVFYKHGSVDTGLEIQTVDTKLDDQTLKIFAHFTKQGNSPYLGTMWGRVYDVTGAMVKEGKVLVSIYYDGLRKLELDVSDLPMGAYDLDVTLETGRTDIPDQDVIKATPSSMRTNFTKL